MKNQAPSINPTSRILSLRKKTLEAKRYVSVEQAEIITRSYSQNENLPVIIKRAKSLAQSLSEIAISIDPEELIVGNRTSGIRAGVVFPEAGINWLSKEIDTIDTRSQDPFFTTKKDISIFRNTIEAYWKGKSLEDSLSESYGEEIRSFEKVVKINQKDHAQGHICPDVAEWLKSGPSGLLSRAELKREQAHGTESDFYDAVIIALRSACIFIERYADLAEQMADSESDNDIKKNLKKIASVCRNLAVKPPESLREALQSVWFLFVILQMESNASSFSPGRMDQYLYPFFIREKEKNNADPDEIIELFDALFIKFNHIVYMRNSHSAMYFAGFPIGFNVTIGGQNINGADATNELSYIFLKAQDHIRLPQPNLTARLHSNSPSEFITACSRVIGLGTGMPQIVNDESIIPALERSDIEHSDAIDYALVGCVELTTQGNYLGWSDAAMFNLVKVLELTLNDGKCLLTGHQIGLRTGYLTDFKDFSAFQNAFRSQIDYFIDKMIKACEVVEKAHKQYLPSPFLSSVIDNCIEKGIDVTAGGAKYNLSGIQLIQIANVADSLAVIKKGIFEDKVISKELILNSLRENFRGNEILRQSCINKFPKYGNDIEWVDNSGAEWTRYFAAKLSQYINIRGGIYNLGLYTVSAHVPMGQNVGATPDGRLACTPLADGGLSPMYGRDNSGPTAVLNSVARIPSLLAGNGTLLNMKFLPSFFENEADLSKFDALLKSFVNLPIHHVQFNVVTGEELRKAKADPESYRGLTIRVAGYTAYFTELASDLQDEIIERTTHG